VANARWIEREQSKTIPNTVVEWDLGPGESAVIALALTALGSTAVIDDLSGRKCALSHGINVMGTLGVVIAAGRCGHIGDPRQVMFELRLDLLQAIAGRKLRAAGMWLSESVIERALRIADGAR
jgi:predicted nucleic acid-binding protein